MPSATRRRIPAAIVAYLLLTTCFLFMLTGSKRLRQRNVENEDSFFVITLYNKEMPRLLPGMYLLSFLCTITIVALSQEEILSRIVISMIQDIAPKKFHVEYHDFSPSPIDTIFLFDGDALFFRLDGEATIFPKFSELAESIESYEKQNVKFRYLFSIDDERFFMPDIHTVTDIQAPGGYEPKENNMFRRTKPRYLAFAGVTAQQLRQWYAAHAYCGRCGRESGHSETERAVVCPHCGLVEYPRISPVVIVAVTNGENLLVTRYKDRPGRYYALVAGFGEIGEALEDTIRREVFEETGVRVKNSKYYKSQPWGFSSSLLSGFFCELDGDDTITMDENELSEALWLARAEIPRSDNDIALTAEMMEMFRTGKIK